MSITSPVPAGRCFVGYARVSTARQGRSGLGLDAQEAAIKAFMLPGDRLLVPLYVEVESGRDSERPKLRAALAHCKRTGATLLIARLDRLARSVRFISSLMEEGVDFRACDMPNATPFMLHIYAAVAEEEARAISKRTKVALAAAKARGVRLGGDRGHRTLTRLDAVKGSGIAAAARRQAADHAAHALVPVLAELRQEGAASLGALARGLAARGVPMPRAGTWNPTAVRRILARIGTAEQPPST